eukprot:SAG11_NODE_21423_length_425_cov_0.950920_1_plen_51_part_10
MAVKHVSKDPFEDCFCVSVHCLVSPFQKDPALEMRRAVSTAGSGAAAAASG